MEKQTSQQQLDSIKLAEDFEPYQSEDRNQVPLTERNKASSGGNIRSVRLLNSQISALQSHNGNVRRQFDSILKSNKFQISDEEMDRVQASRETVKQAKDFISRNKSIDFTKSEFGQEIQDAPEAVDHLLEAIQTIMAADLFTKHEQEVAAVDIITRKISSTKQGERCRDLLKYFSNLKKHFQSCLVQLDTLSLQANERYQNLKDVSIQITHTVIQERDRMKKLQQNLKAREQENATLKEQLEELLYHVKQDERPVIKPLIQQEPVFQFQDLQDQLESELNSYRSGKAIQIFEQLKNEVTVLTYRHSEMAKLSRELQIEKQAMSRQITFLENQVAEHLTLKEDATVDLKSQIVIYKQKAKSLKQQLKVELEQFKQQMLQGERDNCFKEKQLVEMELAHQVNLNQELSAKNEQTQTQILFFKDQERQSELKYLKEIETREQRITSLEEKLQKMQKKYQEQLLDLQSQGKYDSQKKNINVQADQNKDLRLEFLLNSQKKVKQQKKFFDQQCLKYAKELKEFMTKSEVEIKRDQLVSSSTAVARMNEMFISVSQNLSSLKAIISFMIFDENEDQYGEISSINEEEGNFDDNQLNHLLLRTEPISPTSYNVFDKVDQKSENLDLFLMNNKLELLLVMLEWLLEQFSTANGPQSDVLQQLIILVEQNVDQRRLQELQRTFLIENRIHFQQYLFRLKEKCDSLEKERDRLQFEISNLQMQLEDAQEQVDEEIKMDFPQIERQKAKQAPTMLKQMNKALSERVKDIRVFMNRRYNELLDKLKFTVQDYEQQLTKVKVQYGKDLAALNQDHQKALQLKEMEITDRKDTQLYKQAKIHEAQMYEFKFTFEVELNRIVAEKKREVRLKNDYYEELQRQRKESINAYQGGFGTFSIVFENPLHVQLKNVQKQLQDHQKNYEIVQQNAQGVKSHTRKAMILAYQNEEEKLKQKYRELEQALIQKEIIPQEKLHHFIEVGFQFSKTNFLALGNYNEITYDSMARKYIFEFQIHLEPNSESSLLQIENKIRHQLSQNQALFNEINPIYVSLNMGRPVSTWAQDSQPIEKFQVVERKLANVNNQILTINFLKNEKPFDMLRIMALDNNTCQEFGLDLTIDDLFVLVEGNQKLLDEENLSDLFQILVNCLTVFERNLKKPNTKNEYFVQKVLAVEHRCFFNDTHIRNFDQRNRLIKLRHNKITQGLMKNQEIMTDLGQSQIYEGFNKAFETEVQIDISNDSADHFQLLLETGMHTGHMKLTVELKYTQLKQTVCLFNTPNKSQSIAATFIQKPSIGDQESAIAYIISMERLFGQDNVLIKIASVLKISNEMTQFQWHPNGIPNLGSTKLVTQSIFLAKKAGDSNHYCQVYDFDILNTEVRAQLFSQAFGYTQSNVDFGEISTQVDYGDEIANESVLKLTQIRLDQPRQTLRAPIEVKFDLNNKYINRKFTVLRTINQDQQIESHYATVALFTNPKLQEQMLLQCQINVIELNLKLDCEIQTYPVLNTQDMANLVNQINVESISDKLIDLLIVQNGTIVVDPNQQCLSELMQEMRQAQFDEKMVQNGVHQTILEFPNYQTLEITKGELVDSVKIHSNAIIGQRLFKITAFFIQRLKFKVKIRSRFDFDCIYLSCYQPVLDKTFDLVMTEHDIGSLVEMLQEATLQYTSQDLKFDYKSLFSRGMSNQQIMNLCIDALNFDSVSNKIFVCFKTLLATLTERRKCEAEFRQLGGKYSKSSELVSTQLKRTLITSQEKDLSDSKVNIKIYSCTLDSLPGLIKIQVEIQMIEMPDLVYQVDFLTSNDGVGKQVLMERFNLSQSQEAGYNDGLVFNISESSFPHEINFTLLEPCSHVFWFYKYKDDRLNRIERRVDRLAFAKILDESLNQDLFRDAQQAVKIDKGYQKQSQPIKTALISTGNGLQTLGSKKASDYELVYGRTLKYEECYHEFEVWFSEQSKIMKINWTTNTNDGKQTDSYRWKCVMVQSAENSRFYQCGVRSSNGSQMICQIEQSSAGQNKQNALRIRISKVFDESQNDSVLDLIITDSALIRNDSVAIREDVKFSFNQGYRDLANSLSKMDDLIGDINIQKIQKKTELPKTQVNDNTEKVTYRKVIMQNGNTYVVSCMKDQLGDCDMIKLSVFESSTQQQHLFVFNYKDVFTAEELQNLENNKDQLTKLYAEAVNKRLKIKELQVDGNQSFSTYFLNPVIVKGQKTDEILLNKLFPDIQEFDIRIGCQNQLFEPENLFGIAQPQEKETLLLQYESKMLYDVYQVLDPFQLKLKLNVYDKKSFCLAASAICDEPQLRKELTKDGKSYLMDGHKRDELCRYLIENSSLDKDKKLVFFLKS